MIKIEKFTGTKTYMFPNGHIATPDIIIAQFPAVTMFTHVLEVNGDVCQAVMCLSALRQIHNIPKTATEDEAITLIEQIINKPAPPPPPTPEERIAAALEFQNLLSLPLGV